VVRALLAAHTDVNANQANGRTALMAASQQSRLHMVQFLELHLVA
jgi:ankyrin repeat protein